MSTPQPPGRGFLPLSVSAAHSAPATRALVPRRGVARLRCVGAGACGTEAALAAGALLLFLSNVVCSVPADPPGSGLGSPRLLLPEELSHHGAPLERLLSHAGAQVLVAVRETQATAALEALQQSSFVRIGLPPFYLLVTGLPSPGPAFPPLCSLLSPLGSLCCWAGSCCSLQVGGSPD